MPIPRNVKPLQRSSAKERALSQLQQWIVEGTLAPGEKLADADIADALGISRTPVREALQVLELQGFVRMNPGKETRVQDIRREDIQHIYPPLAALEALAAEQAAMRTQIGDLVYLRGINLHFHTAIQTMDLERLLELDDQFHQRIVDMADNPYITSFLNTLQLHATRWKSVFMRSPSLPVQASAVEHERIIAALEERDPAKAAEVMRQNWLRPMRELLKQVGLSAEQ